MNLAAFLEHHGLTENPFRGEEARQDPVFARLSRVDPAAVAAAGTSARLPIAQHPDLEKILGDLASPSTAIVFGEKGSGKTAIRLQISQAVAAHNQASPSAKLLLLPYDDLNGVLDRIHARAQAGMKDKKAPPSETLKTTRLVDHLDALLALAVPRVIDAVLEQPARPAEKAAQFETAPDVKKAARALPKALRRDLLILQAVYDRPEHAEDRTRQLRRRLSLHQPPWRIFETTLTLVGWLLPLAVFVLWLARGQQSLEPLWTVPFFVTLGIWLAFLLKRAATERFIIGRQARRLRRQLRVIARHEQSYAASLRQLPPGGRASSTLPLGDSDEQRYAMVERLLRVIAPFGYSGVCVIVDRVDEPTLISGDTDRMRAVVWPMLNNKFLQQPGLAVKLLLPVELRHALFRESAAFFQEARLDKQCLIERLGWSGPMLYDLCTARLNVCRSPSAAPIGLADLFAPDVPREKLLAALEQMHQPRDAFKFLYRCLSEHATQNTRDQNALVISADTLDRVARQEVERIRQLYMGIRPA